MIRIECGDFRDLAREPDADTNPPALDSVEVVALPPGDWIGADPVGVADPGERLARIRVKNAAFKALTEAALTCERRRHSDGGLVPDKWLARLRTLERAYRAAVEALNL